MSWFDIQISTKRVPGCLDLVFDFYQYDNVSSWSDIRILVKSNGPSPTAQLLRPSFTMTSPMLEWQVQRPISQVLGLRACGPALLWMRNSCCFWTWMLGHWTCHFEGSDFLAVLFELFELLVFWSRGAIITIIRKLLVFLSPRWQTSQILNYWSKLNHWAQILAHCWRRNQHPNYLSNWAPGHETRKYWNYWKTANTVQ